MARNGLAVGLPVTPGTGSEAAGGGGWMFDAFDIMLLALLAVPIMKGLHLAAAQLALVFSIQLARGGGPGGVVMGTMADCIGRRSAMMINILVYSLSTGLIFFAHSLSTLLVLRFFTGLGLGGEWGLGMTLVAGRIPDRFRGRAVAFANIGWPCGTLLAAVFAYFVNPALGWRATFALAAFPALLVLWIRACVPESDLWKNVRRVERELRKNPPTLLAIVGKRYVRYTVLIFLAILCTQFSYWMFWTWLPTFLVKTRGFTLSGSIFWMIVTQVGALGGYITNGITQDRIGRRTALCCFTVGEAVMMVIFLLTATNSAVMYLLALLLGFFTGYWAGYGSIVTENFPTRIRSTAAGVTYNLARAVSFVGPVLITTVAAAASWTTALAMPAVAALLVGILVWTLPETRGRNLAVLDEQ
ncbi:MAG: MFS transporter [Peptococcaceae bacterium]|nr:MFS transporter [Peptococcaceae bacterium]